MIRASLDEMYLTDWWKDKNDVAMRPRKDIASVKAYRRKLPQLQSGEADVLTVREGVTRLGCSIPTQEQLVSLFLVFLMTRFLQGWTCLGTARILSVNRHYFLLYLEGCELQLCYRSCGKMPTYTLVPKRN